jgi:hypothetical protein
MREERDRLRKEHLQARTTKLENERDRMKRKGRMEERKKMRETIACCNFFGGSIFSPFFFFSLLYTFQPMAA